MRKLSRFSQIERNSSQARSGFEKGAQPSLDTLPGLRYCGSIEIQRTPVRVKKDIFSDGRILGAGTAFWEADISAGGCGVETSLVWEYVNTSVSYDDVFQTPFVVGQIILNTAVSANGEWHTLGMDGSGGFGNPNIAADDFDLYSVVLHEALHMLGFQSRIQAGGSAQNGFYSIWDEQLYSYLDNEYVILQGEDPDCCDFHEYNGNIPLPLSLDRGCTGQAQNPVVFGADNLATVYADYPPGLFNNDDHLVANFFSHINQTCDGDMYVMHPSSAPGEHLRALSQSEKDILCRLGYAAGNSSGGCESDCAVVAIDDGVFYGDDDFTIDFDVFLENDVYPEGESYELSFYTCNGEFLEIIEQGSPGFEEVRFVNSSANYPYIICYALESECGSCSVGQFVVFNEDGGLPPSDPTPCNSEENLFPYGDFEAFSSLGTSIDGERDNYFSQLGILKCNPNFFAANNPINSPDVHLYADNKIVQIGGVLSVNSPASSLIESIFVPLARPVNPGCQINLEFDYKLTPSSVVMNTGPGRLEVYGTKLPPCFSSGAPNCSDPLASGDFYCFASGIDVTSEEDWTAYSSTFTNNTGAPINYLIFVNNLITLLGEGFDDDLTSAIQLDNIFISDLCGDELTVTYFSNSVVRMLEGARILVENGGALGMYNSFFHGCAAMWRGIEVEQGGILGMKANNRIDDAQYAVYAHAAAPGEPLPYIAVEGNFFVDNFVGIYMGGPGKVDAFIAGNGFYGAESLLPPFAGQSAAPQGLPEQNGFSLAGIYVDRVRTPFSYPQNIFSGLASGIVLNSASGRISRSTFESIEFGAYPDYAFDGEAATSQGTGGTTLGVEKCVFTNCNAGIVAAEVALEATSNTMDEVRYGISARLSNAGAVTIGGEGDKRNAIRQSKVGILVNHRGTGPVAITENEVSVSDADWGWGIALLFHHAPTLAKKNTVEAYGATTGMLLLSCSDADLFGNSVTLMDMPEAHRGISLGNAYGCRLRENGVTGPGSGGSENIGYALQFSPDNIYCCNAVDKTRIGVRVVDGCQAEDNFRGTVFGDHATALLLDASGILGAQNHMRNRWTGSGGAEYLAPLQAPFYQFIVDITPPNGSLEYLPNPVTPSDWFDIDEDEGGPDVCPEENCLVDGFNPESPDSKRIAKGEIDVGEHTDIIQWHLSRFLYRKLKEYTGEDEDILDFIETGGGSSVGAFDALEEGIEALLSEGLENQLLVQANLAFISARLKEVGVLDSLYLEADEAGQDSLWLLRGQLLDTLAALALETSGLNEAVNHQRSLSAASLAGQNAGI
ncbi:MAG: hypothetical protein J5I98_20225 [Phaeodactylibacter sp.]|nr:hypothetical protein [Phaeodactylibacter sp.]